MSNSGKINPEDKYQRTLNNQFNQFLQSTNKRMSWQYIDRKQDIYQIYRKTMKDAETA